MSSAIQNNYWMCRSCLNFEVDVPGSKPHVKYAVRHGFFHNYRDTLLDFSCTCLSYEYNRHRGQRYCKHINGVIDKGLFCGWDQIQDGLDSADGKCPKCGEDVVTINTLLDETS